MAGGERAFDVTGRVAVVTGAARGIGRGVALELAAAGAHLVLGDLDEGGLAATAEEARAAGVRAETLRVDVSRRDDVRDLVGRALGAFDRLDLMANVAGVIADASVARTREEDLDRILAVNAKGVFFGCQAAAEAMRERGGGSIVNMASLAAFRAFPTLAAYGMSKAAVIALTRTLALEVGRHGIRVNAVAPGFVRSHMTGRHVLREDGSIDEARMQDVIADAQERNPLRIVGEPEDVARAVIFLASDAARYVTGQVLHVNGGGFMP